MEKDLSYYIQSHPNLPKEALERVARQNHISSGSETDDSSGEQMLERLMSSPKPGTESCETSETSWDEEDVMENNMTPNKQSNLAQGISGVVAFDG